jgi:hypothetical protein
MITTQQGQDMREMQWVLATKNGMAASGTLVHDPADNDLKDNLYKIVSLSLLFFDAIVKPFDRMIEEEDRFLDGLDLG